MNEIEIISGIYCIENIINQKKYIGQSIDIYSRWQKHKNELNNECHYNSYLQEAWNLNGKKAFKFYILEPCEIRMLDEREKYYIALYNTFDRDYGYNLTDGGQRGHSISEETRQKLKESLTLSYFNQELRDTRRKDALKQWANPEIKAKILGANNGMFGKHHSKEAKEKIRQARLGRPCSRRNTTPVFCLERNEKFKDSTDAAKLLHLDSSAILKVCRNERKTCGGYHWKFLNGK